MEITAFERATFFEAALGRSGPSTVPVEGVEPVGRLSIAGGRAAVCEGVGRWATIRAVIGPVVLMAIAFCAGLRT